MIMFSMEGRTFAYDNPELLPKEQTPIIDLAKALSEKQRLDSVSYTHLTLPTKA